MEPPLAFALAAAAVVLAGVAGYLARSVIEKSRRARDRTSAQDEASRILARAEDEAASLKKGQVLEGKEEAFRLRET